MIEGKELEALRAAVDAVFKYPINAIVQPAALGDYVEAPTGIHAEKTKDSDWSYALTFSGSRSFRYQIVERLLQQCHGGIQKHYLVRLVTHEGGVDRQLIQLTEDELVLAAPFRRDKGMTADEIRAYPDKPKRDRPLL